MTVKKKKKKKEQMKNQRIGDVTEDVGRETSAYLQTSGIIHGTFFIKLVDQIARRLLLSVILSDQNKNKPQASTLSCTQISLKARRRQVLLISMSHKKYQQLQYLQTKKDDGKFTTQSIKVTNNDYFQHYCAHTLPVNL